MTCAKQKQCQHGDGCFMATDYDVARCTAFKPLVQTNEEWLRQCTTEQLAKWIAHQTMIALLENQNNHSLRMTYPAYWVAWLKQPHND